VAVPDLLDTLDELKDPREVVGRVAWDHAAEVMRLQVIMRALVYDVSLTSQDRGITHTMLPESMPRPRGEYATIVTPSSRAVLRRSIFGSSMSSENGEYSIWRALIGCTACARRSVDAEHSERPRYLTLPCLQ
jgi:hypothetical protein